MWNILSSDIRFEMIALNELKLYLDRTNIIVIDIKVLDSEKVIVFYRD